MKRKSILAALVLVPLTVVAGRVASPNGDVVLNFSLDDKGRPTYDMSYKGRPVVLPSHLGLELAKDKHASRGLDERSLMDGFTLVDEQTSTTDETWRPVWGETATIRNHYVEYAAKLAQHWTQPRGRQGICDGSRGACSGRDQGGRLRLPDAYHGGGP